MTRNKKIALIKALKLGDLIFVNARRYLNEYNSHNSYKKMVFIVIDTQINKHFEKFEISTNRGKLRFYLEDSILVIPKCA